MNQVTIGVEMMSFAVVALLGAVLTWRKSGKVLGTLALARNPLAGQQADDCDHVHIPPPDQLGPHDQMARHGGRRARRRHPSLRGRPRVLVFALSQGLFAAGIAATFAMALGTALTTGAIAVAGRFRKGVRAQDRRWTRSRRARSPSPASSFWRRPSCSCWARACCSESGAPVRRARSEPIASPSPRGSCVASMRPLRGCRTIIPACPSASA